MTPIDDVNSVTTGSVTDATSISDIAAVSRSSNGTPESDQLTLLPPVSPAPTSASPAPGRASPARRPDSGPRSPVLLTNYDPNTSSWRTSQRCLLEGWGRFSETWPRSGMTVNGIAYRLPPSAHLTDGIDGGGLHTPTPTGGDGKASGSRNTPGSKARAGVSLTDFVRGDGGRGRFPSPSANPAGTLTPDQVIGKPEPNERVYLKSTGQHTQVTLDRYVTLFPTPDASPHKYRLQGNSQQSKSLNALASGKLNPEWVAWLMGYPPGWLS